MRDNLLNWYCDNLPISYPVKIRKTYEKCYIKSRVNYTLWLDKINKKFGDNIDWWMTVVPSRNPYLSDILHYISVLETIKETKLSKIKIHSQSKELLKLIEKNFSNKKITCEFVENKEHKTNLFFNILKSFLFHFFLFIYINLFEKKKLNKNLVIIDKFITQNFNQNLNYFPELNKTKYCIVPTFIPTINFIKLIKMIKFTKKNNKNILWKEHYINFGDIIFALLNYLRRKKFKKSTYWYKNFNLSLLIYKEIEKFNDYFSVTAGLINYRFFLRLSKYNFLNIQSINWFENQIIDKGWNMGFKKYFTKFKKNSFGYQDFNKHYNLISNSPSKSEYEKNVTPENLVVISKYFKKITCEFFKKQKIIIGETHRFRNLIKLKIKPTNKKKVLFILSGIKKIDIELIKIAKKISILDPKNNFYIKCHPILKKNFIVKENLPKNLIFLDTKLSLILKETLVSITAGPSSAILESICHGTFLILPDIECGTSFNPKMFGFKNYIVTDNEIKILRKIKKIIKRKTDFKNNNFINKEKFKYLSEIT